MPAAKPVAKKRVASATKTPKGKKAKEDAGKNCAFQFQNIESPCNEISARHDDENNVNQKR